MKALSQNKGSRWDDIVNKFEYSAVVLPALEKKIVSSSIAQVHKDAVQQYIKNNNDLDIKGIEEIIQALEMCEKDANYSDIIRRATSAAHERIKHAQLLRLQDLTKLQEQTSSFKLHDGFNKECGLKGSKLSGGQK